MGSAPGPWLMLCPALHPESQRGRCVARKEGSTWLSDSNSAAHCLWLLSIHATSLRLDFPWVWGKVGLDQWLEVGSFVSLTLRPIDENFGRRTRISCGSVGTGGLDLMVVTMWKCVASSSVFKALT